MGTRLGSLTRDIPKCMVPVNGTPLIDRLIDQFVRLSEGKLRFVIAIGYLEDVLRSHLAARFPDVEIVYVPNEVYATTNNIYSLYLCREQFAADDTILVEADLIYADAVIERMLGLKGPNATAAVAAYQSWMDGTMVKLNDRGMISQFISKADFRYDERREYYKTMNIYRFPKAFISKIYVPFLETYIKAFGRSMYYEQVLSVLSFINSEIRAEQIEEPWYEIDDIQDLDIATTLFSPTERKYDEYHSRYGGFWRFPGLIDFCYLVNPLFPTERMLDEMKSSFDELVRSYPSGQRVNALTAAKCFNIRPDYVCVGNGAAELIAVLADVMEIRRAGMIFPSFDEYTNRFIAAGTEIEAFVPQTADFSFTADELTARFAAVDTIILINPNNPTGYLLERAEVMKLLEWCQTNGKRLLLDESFIDFASRRAESLLDDRVMEQYSNLYILKSISKSYGVPGLRLGFIASADTDTINRFRKKVGIWNINSPAEHWLQIFSKHKADFITALDHFQHIRTRFIHGLGTTGIVEPIPTEANFVMCRVKCMSSASLVALLANEHNIMAANLKLKANFSDNMVRFAIRNDVDNNALVDALKAINSQR